MINVYDLETYEENGEIVPYCAAFKINEQTGHVYYENEKNLIIESLDNIIKIKNQDKYVIYVHNLNFDGYLIISVLSKNKIDFQTFKRKLNLYWLKFNFLGKDFEFRCSYKILPLSLNSISKIDKNQKLLFPYRFVSKKTLNYLKDQ